VERWVVEQTTKNKGKKVYSMTTGGREEERKKERKEGRKKE
jgi:hypothetical protein